MSGGCLNGSQGGRPMSTAIPSLSENAALNLLRQPGFELVLLHLAPSGSGHAFYIAPGGGRVKDADAEKILQRPDVQPHSAGLFPETVQSWRMVRRP
jgi:hypothetical protein